MIKIPPPIQTFIGAALMYGVDLFIPLQVIEGGVIVNSLLVILLVSALFLLLPAVYSFWQSKTTVNPIKPEAATTLVITGVYRYTRNPMYLGMALILIAWGMYLGNPVNVVVFIAYVVVMTAIQIKPEERALAKLFGEDYQTYCESVRRWI